MSKTYCERKCILYHDCACTTCCNDAYQQGRADAIDDLQKLYLDWQKEIKDFYYADEETTRFLKRLKTHLNLDEVKNS